MANPETGSKGGETKPDVKSDDKGTQAGTGQGKPLIEDIKPRTPQPTKK